MFTVRATFLTNADPHFLSAYLRSYLRCPMMIPSMSISFTMPSATGRTFKSGIHSGGEMCILLSRPSWALVHGRSETVRTWEILMRGFLPRSLPSPIPYTADLRSGFLCSSFCGGLRCSSSGCLCCSSKIYLAKSGFATVGFWPPGVLANIDKNPCFGQN